ncbi:hypothetical protein [Reichenbachiella sp.]|uniref:hypothetical protein n=1 Tax=Reichenbachiella sp. TaxID=2184521 RepID=UPI003BB1B87A
MNIINHISKYKTLILTIGMIAALGIIGQPIMKAYADCEFMCQMDKDVNDKKDSSDKENPNEAQISTLEAVAPTAQIHFAPLDFVMNDQPEVEPSETQTLDRLAVRLPEKLLKVLFNIIIAPNAP